MGMFDTIIVEDNVLNIPNGHYQTKDLDCVLDVYKISGDSFVLEGTEGLYKEVSTPCIADWIDEAISMIKIDGNKSIEINIKKGYIK